jgi:hypothetical protein
MNLRTDTQLINYFWSLVGKNGPLPGKSTGGKIPLLALDRIRLAGWLWPVQIRGSHIFTDSFRLEAKKWGVILGPLTVSTRCQNKTCVRHRFSRTRRAVGKATGSHPGLLGEDHPNAKLTAKQVLQIRELCATGTFLQKDLAARFNVSRAPLRKIVSKESWRRL